MSGTLHGHFKHHILVNVKKKNNLNYSKANRTKKQSTDTLFYTGDFSVFPRIFTGHTDSRFIHQINLAFLAYILDSEENCTNSSKLHSLS